MILYAHLTILALTALVIIFTDFNGLLWLLGKKKTLPKKLFMWLHRAVWVGLFGMIATGVAMSYTYISALSMNQLFQGKMFFVLLLLINAYLIGRHMELAFEKSFAELTKKEKTQLILSGLISTGSWVGAFIMAKLLFG